MDRKTFLKWTGAGLLGTAVADRISGAMFKAEPPRIGLQLYTVRDAIKQDLQGTLNKVAESGYKYVETAFWPEAVTLNDAAAAIRKAGLLVSSCHVELPLGDDEKAFSETAEAFGCKKLIWHGWPEDKRYSSLEGTRELIGIYNKTADYARSKGIEFGLHNHWWEYRNQVGGKPVFEWLLKETDPSIFFEIDTYWVKVAGFTPADIVNRFGRRARFLHMKDGPARYNEKLAVDNPDPMTALGRGTQDIPAIVHAALFAEFLVVEMDKTAGDVFIAIKESYDYLHQQFHLV